MQHFHCNYPIGGILAAKDTPKCATRDFLQYPVLADEVSIVCHPMLPLHLTQHCDRYLCWIRWQCLSITAGNFDHNLFDSSLIPEDSLRGLLTFASYQLCKCLPLRIAERATRCLDKQRYCPFSIHSSLYHPDGDPVCCYARIPYLLGKQLCRQ